MPNVRRIRFPLAAAAATAVALAVAGPASAHIHTDPESVEAGVESTVGFIVEHGCDGSPTTKVELQLPDGFTGIAGVDEAGFTASVDGRVVTFAGGELPDGTEQAFKVTFTAPDEPGDVSVPLIQTCAEGSTDWITEEVEGQPEPEHPAPILTITASTSPTTTTEAATTSTTATAEPATTTTAAASTTGAPTTTVAVGASSTDEDDDDSSSSAPLIIGIVAAVVVLGGGGALYARSRTAG